MIYSADGKPQSPYAKIPTTLIDTPEHQQIAHQVVKESVVMLTNGKTTPAADAARVLPMDPKSLKTVLVVGPTANDITVQAHTYHGTPSQWVTILDGINSTLQSQAPHVSLTYIQGCDRTSTGTSAKAGFAKATAAVAQADAVIFVGGLQASMEEEGTDRVNDMGHPGVQLDLIKALHSAAQAKSSRIPLVVVTVSGGPVAERYLGMDPMGTQGTAWLWLSYFGQDGGGVADVIFGAYSPSGRTPFSVPTSHSQLGDIADYSMVQSGGYGRTYRYNRYANATAAPMFPFCHGLSYANLSMTLSINSSTASMGDTVNASVAISRYDDMSIAQDVVVALFGEFLTDNEGTSPVTALPVRQLVKFEKVTVPAGARANAASVHLVFTMTEDALPGVDRQPWPGTLKLWVGDGGGYGGSMAPQRKVATAAELATLHLQL
jgi:beta-glucosidase